MYIQRTLEKEFLRESDFFPVMLIAGPRQVGKTTLLKHLAEANRTYVTLDDPMAKMLAKNDPKTFLDRFQPPVLIDEVQYAPELFPYIKMKVDSDPTPGQFWLTGSQQFQMMKGVSESLAGRVGILTLYGFSQQEMKHRECVPFRPDADFALTEEANHILDVFHMIWKGSYPKMFGADDSFWEAFYSSYLNSYIERDVRDLTLIKDTTVFTKFIRLVAARTGQELNYSDLSRDAELPQATIRNYLGILEASSLIYLLQPYSNNLNQRLIKRPKVYFLDTGLAAYLTGWSNAKVLEAGAMAGAFFETWCLGELLKSYAFNGKKAPFYYYRDKDKREIDLVIEQDGTLYPVEFKKSSNPTSDAVRHFFVLEQFKKPIGKGAVICTAGRYLPLDANHVAIPTFLI